MSEEKKEKQLEEQQDKNSDPSEVEAVEEATVGTEAAGEKAADEAAKAAAGEADGGTDQAAEAAPKKAGLTEEERAARRAAREAAKAGKADAGAAGSDQSGEAAAEAAPPEPSPNQPLLDKLTAIIRAEVGAEAVEEAYINEADGHLPVVIVKNEHWSQTAALLKNKEDLQLQYLINLSGVDLETQLEVVYHMESFQTGEQYCVKVRTDREAPSIPSVTPIWSTANWPEREVYDLLGINFPGHPDLRRIMMPDDWVGHPLRKDYEPLDPEV